jgi:Fur family ferric uptake transcriptional regulator
MDQKYPELNWLREQGFRLTPQRLAIMDVLRKAHDHLSPTEIYQQVAQIIPGLTEATVYRTLNFLAEQGLVLVAHLGRGQLVYEFAGHDHHHLVCRNCGEMHEIDHLELKPLYENFLDSTGYQINSIHATFFGYCPECLEDRSG